MRITHINKYSRIQSDTNVKPIRNAAVNIAIKAKFLAVWYAFGSLNLVLIKSKVVKFEN